ncbi:unnamed protein product [Ranitomeya imitator]|uniref:Uncharacterized protein n=1 Tax=Ranitomeya imitator TaxID=111125 RepID=A0ABN9MLI0_9NEOB|nr:unnamed protein product [Ranitomeya imitator]
MHKHFGRVRVEEQMDSGSIFELEATGSGESLDVQFEGQGRVNCYSEAVDFGDRGKCDFIYFDRIRKKTCLELKEDHANKSPNARTHARSKTSVKIHARNNPSARIHAKSRAAAQIHARTLASLYSNARAPVVIKEILATLALILASPKENIIKRTALQENREAITTMLKP